MKVLMLKAVGAVLIVQERREFKTQGIKFKVRNAKFCVWSFWIS